MKVVLYKKNVNIKVAYNFARDNILFPRKDNEKARRDNYFIAIFLDAD